MRVLVVEDDAGIALGLRANLQQRGYEVELDDGVASAWEILRCERFDLVLLDLGLTDGDGATLLRRLRQGGIPPVALPDPHTPVLIMTARDRVADRIWGLDLGADDYLVKPFNVDELAARMRALLRRSAGRANALLTHGDLVIDPATHAVQRAGQPVELAPREYALLLLLLQSRGRVMSRQQIESRLYSPQEAVESNAVEVHVHHLRRKLGNELIHTMRGVGYFIARDETP